MADREKVIKALELEIKYENIWDCRNECPYYGITDRHCFTQVMVDALELLKEQEPRVLTWDEVERAEVCWMEQRGWEPYAELDAADWNPECYGKEIRCWSAKPTKEQREAVKWDDTSV